MADPISDGTISWIGGMDTSRGPADIAETQYSKAVNVIMPDSLGGMKTRFGFHASRLTYDSKETRAIYRGGNVQACDSFRAGSINYIILLIDGYVLRFTPTTYNAYYVENLNLNDRNEPNVINGWIIQIPDGCIVNNGVDYPIIITANTQRRSNPEIGEIGIGKMGVYVQHRLFYVDQSSRRILASDFLQPTKFTREDTNIYGFMCPDDSEIITAIAKQKTILSYAEGGNLIWSSNKDIYAADVRGTRSDWANPQSQVGKTTETIPGFSAASSHSFESFNSNIYFRSKQYGIVDIKQSEYQFVNLDSVNNQSIEASYFLDNDTDWMLHKCYTRACNSRLFTTVGPQINEDGHIYWNGILSFHPAATYINQGTTPRRFESVFTGIRPWCLTVISSPNESDRLIVHSHDKDGINRMYIMDENTDFDSNSEGQRIEIEGFIELRAFDFKNPFLQKIINNRFYRLEDIQRTTSVEVLTRSESSGEWVSMWNAEHLVCRTTLNENGSFNPVNSKPQSRAYVMMPEEKFHKCKRQGNKCISIQYRFEFKGSMTLHSFISIAEPSAYELTVSRKEKECTTLVYDYRPDYNYKIQ